MREVLPILPHRAGCTFRRRTLRVGMAGPPRFSAAVMLGDLNDFIVPAQACVNPLFAPDVNAAPASLSEGERKGRARISLDSDVLSGIPTKSVKPDLIKSTGRQTARVTLSDCLACSGCVTSAETVLITQQSVGEFRSLLHSGGYASCTVTLAPQAIASIAVHFRLSPIAAYRRLATYFHSIGVAHVYDSVAASNVALMETAAEFVATHDPARRHTLITSACPGWICYAEKSVPESLPYISKVKSPQQLMGLFVKRLSSPATSSPGEPAGRVLHVSVMPCFDKKLEASRTEFAVGEDKDVDCVLTSMEVLDMLESEGVDLCALPESPLRVPGASPLDATVLCSVTADETRMYGPVSHSAGSGGFLDYTFRHAAAALFGVSVPPGPLPFVKGRNPDFEEVFLEKDGVRVLSFAKAYGFRNIATITTKLKRGGCPYDFVEIMACPRGCVNGGGQARPVMPGDGPLTPDATNAVVDAVSAALHDRDCVPAEASAAAVSVYTVLGCGPGGSPLLHTAYKAVPKMVDPMGASW